MEDEERLKLIEDGIQRLLIYLRSEKFWEDTTVQVSDVILRLEEIL